MMIKINDISSDSEQKTIHIVLDPRLLEMLVCPVSKCSLVYAASTKELHSSNAHLAYPVRDGIPIMLIEEARRIAD
jgi:uncharacterized protein YbaR (Trm112 family)